MPEAVDATTNVDAAADQGGVDTGTDERGTTTGAEDVEGADQLGDAGKKALDAMKAERNAAKAAALKADTDRKALLAELQQLRNAEADRSRTDEERTREQERRNAEQAATAKANQRLLRSEIRAAAAGKLADPADALAFLDLTSFDVDDEGDVNQDQISAAIADLVEKRPYLAAAATAKKVFPAADAGAARKGQEGPKQLTREDLNSMSAEQIMAAQKAGLMKELLGSKG